MEIYQNSQSGLKGSICQGSVILLTASVSTEFVTHYEFVYISEEFCKMV
jgi:hypothetical protein